MERRHFLKLTFRFIAGAAALAAGAEAAPLPPVTPEGQGLVPSAARRNPRSRRRTMSIVLRRSRCGGDAAGVIAGVIGATAAAVCSGAAAFGATVVAGSGAAATGAAVTGNLAVSTGDRKLYIYSVVIPDRRHRSCSVARGLAPCAIDFIDKRSAISFPNRQQPTWRRTGSKFICRPWLWIPGSRTSSRPGMTVASTPP